RRSPAITTRGRRAIKPRGIFDRGFGRHNRLVSPILFNAPAYRLRNTGPVDRTLDRMKSVVMTAALAGLFLAAPAHAQDNAPAPVDPKAQRVTNPVAEFTGIDKITGRIINFDVYIDETVQFGALQVTPRVCYSRPEAE